jgi:primary-amine oxidase
MQSTNAILLTTPARPGDAFPFEDYGVKPVSCVPEAPPPFEYAPQIRSGPGGIAHPMPLGTSRELGLTSGTAQRVMLG